MRPLNGYLIVKQHREKSALALPETCHDGIYEVVVPPEFEMRGVVVGARVVIDTLSAAGARSSGILAIGEDEGCPLYAIDYRHLVAVL